MKGWEERGGKGSTHSEQNLGGKSWLSTLREMPISSLMLGFMTRKFVVRREMCNKPDCFPQYLSEVLGFVQATYGYGHV